MSDTKTTGCYGLDLEGATRYPTVSALLAAVRAGQHDVIDLGSLEGLGLTLAQIAALVEDLAKRGVTASADGVDLTCEAGRALLAGCARVEAATASRRALRSLATKRARGQHVGRPVGTGGRPTKATPDVVAEVLRLRAEGVVIRKVAERVKLSAQTICEIIKRAKE